MNGFTKDELREIADALDYKYITSGISASKTVNKIQSMIDNYCEHDWIFNQHEQPKYCINCKKDYE